MVGAHACRSRPRDAGGGARDPRRGRGDRAAGGTGLGQADPRLPGRGGQGRRDVRVLRGLDRQVLRQRDSGADLAPQLHAPRAGRRGAADHALERAGVHLRLAGGARGGDGQRRAAQALGADALHLAGGRPARRAGRAAARPGQRAGRLRSHRRAGRDRASRGEQGGVRRLAGHRRAHRRGRRAPRAAVRAGAGRQVGQYRVRRRRPQARRADRPGGDLRRRGPELRGRLASAGAARRLRRIRRDGRCRGAKDPRRCTARRRDRGGPDQQPQAVRPRDVDDRARRGGWCHARLRLGRACRGRPRRLLRGADRADRRVERDGGRAHRDLRAGGGGHPVQHRGRGDRDRQRHRLRPGRRGLDHRRGARASRGRAGECRHLLGQRLQDHQRGLAVRRLRHERLRPLERGRGAVRIHADQERVGRDGRSAAHRVRLSVTTGPHSTAAGLQGEIRHGTRTGYRAPRAWRRGHRQGPALRGRHPAGRRMDRLVHVQARTGQGRAAADDLGTAARRRGGAGQRALEQQRAPERARPVLRGRDPAAGAAAVRLQARADGGQRAAQAGVGGLGAGLPGIRPLRRHHPARPAARVAARHQARGDRRDLLGGPRAEPRDHRREVRHGFGRGPRRAGRVPDRHRVRCGVHRRVRGFREQPRHLRSTRAGDGLGRRLGQHDGGRLGRDRRAAGPGDGEIGACLRRGQQPDHHHHRYLLHAVHLAAARGLGLSRAGAADRPHHQGIGAARSGQPVAGRRADRGARARLRRQAAGLDRDGCDGAGVRLDRARHHTAGGAAGDRDHGVRDDRRRCAGARDGAQDSGGLLGIGGGDVPDLAVVPVGFADRRAQLAQRFPRGDHADAGVRGAVDRQGHSGLPPARLAHRAGVLRGQCRHLHRRDPGGAAVPYLMRRGTAAGGMGWPAAVPRRPTRALPSA
ncbi:putative Alkaline phosphatase [Burkholderia ambifaria]